jgi:hypothetical protein
VTSLSSLKAMLDFCFPNYRERTVIRMMRKFGILLAVVIAIVSFLYASQAQTEEKKGMKTVTLPNGEVVLDMSGEWDVLVENYGAWSFAGSYPQKMNVTQEGSSFVGTRMIDDPYNQKGSTVIRGELDKNGIKKVTVMTAMGPQDAKGEISDDGNKIIIDVYAKGKQTLTRK